MKLAYKGILCWIAIARQIYGNFLGIEKKLNWNSQYLVEMLIITLYTKIKNSVG